MAFDQILRRNFWAVLLVFVIAAAFLNAQAISHLVGVVVAPDPAQLALPSLASKSVATVAYVSPHVTSADAILSRNPFDSVTGALNKVPEPEVSETAQEAPPDTSDPKNDPVCEAVKVLIITKADTQDWSFAAFSGSDGKIILRRRTGEVGDKKVTWIGWDRVWLTSGTQRCQAKLFAPPAPPEAAKADKPAEKPAETKGTGGPPSTLDPAIAKGISKKSATEYDIDRAVVDKILENQADLMRTARIVPEQENGKTVGIRMFGVRDGTLLSVLGMENGDRLQQINGFDMGSPEKALEAYARLRTADHLTVQVNRRGTNTNLDYNIK